MKKTTSLTFAFAFMIFAMSAAPAYAAGGPIESGVDWILELLTSGIARSVAIIGIACLGYMAWAGKLTWEKAIHFMVGIVLVFGGATLVDLLIGAVS